MVSWGKMTLAAGVASAALLGMASQAAAQTAATASEYVQEYSGPLQGDEVNSGLGTVSYAGASATVSGAPGGAVTAVANGDNLAEGDLTYYATVTGPGVVAPFDLFYDLRVHSKIGNAISSVSLTTDQTSSLVTVKRFGFSSVVLPVVNDTMSLSGELQDWGTVGTEAKIQLSAQGVYDGTAYVDPLFELDPAWAAANPALASQISISLSSGITNGYGVPAVGGGVPEPASWAMLLLGLGGMGAVLRGSRRKLAGAVAAA